MAKMNDRKERSGSALGFEAELWAAADKMRGHMDASDYKHVCLGLIFLKYNLLKRTCAAEISSQRGRVAACHQDCPVARGQFRWRRSGELQRSWGICH